MNRKFIGIGMAVAAAFAVQVAIAQEKAMPLAEARAQIEAIVADPASITGVMKQLAPADQTAFLASVNAAISKMPGSSEEKAAKFINVNKAAMKGAAKGNLANLVAEVFKTVPVEYLALVGERFADDLFNRGSDPSRSYDDASFQKIAEGLLDRIMSRTAETDDASVRNALAVAMLVRAANGKAGDPLFESLVAKLPNDETREIAVKEWLPDALAEKPSYDSMLAYAGVSAEGQPDPSVSLQLAGPQMLDCFLADVSSSLIDAQGRETTPFTDQITGGFKDPVFFAVQGAQSESPATSVGDGQPPRTDDQTKAWNSRRRRNEPIPYQ